MNLEGETRARKITHAMRAFGRGVRRKNVEPERASARARAWNSLPEALQTQAQWFGSHTVGCFATHNIYEACNFSCTACYLTPDANATPPLAFADVAQQLDDIRAFGGPGANTQITAGEVTLLPVAELCRIIRYARHIGLDPMLMTNGEIIDADPDYLRTLIEKGGLEKISFHVDTTQRGRSGVKKTATEQDLHAVRDRFANILRQVRRQTGQTLYSAQTVTLTRDNLDQIPTLVDWFLKNADTFRMIGFLPTAAVGRTRAAETTHRTETIWRQIATGLGLDDVNPHPVVIGDPRCNQTALLWSVRFGDEYRALDVARRGKKIDQRFMRELFSGAFRGFVSDGKEPAELAGSFLGTFLRSPKYAWQWPAYAAYRMFPHKSWLPDFVAAVASGKPWWIRPLVIVCHNFMSSSELATAEGQERLASCMFRLPVDGRMMSMCEMNGTELRRESNQATLAAQTTGTGLLNIERKAKVRAARKKDQTASKTKDQAAKVHQSAPSV